MAKKTPPLYSRGRFTLKMPYATVPTKLYTVIAIRSFDDIYKLGIDVYATYYQPAGLTDGQDYNGEAFSFAAEVAAKANIITLRSDDNEYVYVPDTWILSYPNMSEIKYSRMILSVALPPLPDYLDLSALKTGIQDLASQMMGTPTVTVQEHRAAATSNPTAAQHDALEVARLNGVTLLETDYALLQKEKAKNILLQAQVDALVARLQVLGDIPT